NEASTQVGDADLLRPIACLLRRSQRGPIVARRCRGNVRRRWSVGCGGEQVAKVRGGANLSAPSRQEIVQEHTVAGAGRGFEISDEGRLRFASCERRRCATVGIRW